MGTKSLLPLLPKAVCVNFYIGWVFVLSPSHTSMGHCSPHPPQHTHTHVSRSLSDRQRELWKTQWSIISKKPKFGGFRMRRQKDANKRDDNIHQQTMVAGSRLWAITISSSFMVHIPLSCELFSCGSGVASLKTTPNLRSGHSPRLSNLNQDLWLLHDLVVWPVSSIITVIGAKLPNRAASRLWSWLKNVPALSHDDTHPSCDTNVSDLPTKMAAKDPKRQLPDVLHESEGINAPCGRLME